MTTIPLDIVTPLTGEVLAKLHTGDHVTITGVIYTARDAAHKRLIEALN
ncbi:MAG: fumarate hydratase C-terminal domain-containing protein, partial [Chloroflexota bacterium]